MKKITIFCTLFWALSLPLAFSSCSNDDDDDQDKNSIVGTWTFLSTTAGTVESNGAAGDNSKISGLITGWADEDFSNITLTFSANGTCTLTDSGETRSGTYTFENGLLSLTWGDNPAETGKASLTNGILTIERDYTENCEYLELDELIELGIGNPTDFTVTKAIANVSFNK